jgi:hypothetical protein
VSPLGFSSLGSLGRLMGPKYTPCAPQEQPPLSMAWLMDETGEFLTDDSGVRLYVEAA